MINLLVTIHPQNKPSKNILKFFIEIINVN